MLNELLVERVLRAAECLPSGRVATYGQLASLVGTGPRQVGTIMSRYGGSVPWWRVVNAQGRLPRALTARAFQYWKREETPLVGSDVRPDSARIDLKRAGVDPEYLEVHFRSATADLPDEDD